MQKLEYVVQSGERVHVTTGVGIFDARMQELCIHPAQLWAVDENVYALHKDKISTACAGCGGSLHIVPAGEASKCREQKTKMEDAAFKAGLARDGLIVAIGGGVVGDLAGYVAATYMRGIDFVQVPTTVVAMVDSSIGGKTGIDVPQGKNLIGAFKHPIEIVADLSFLDTLPDTEFRDGFAEVVKHAAIRDADLFEILEDHVLQDFREPTLLETTIVRNQQIKIDVVTSDTKEAGLRKILNFGHTLGHSIEALANFERSHGVCVAEGMLLEAALGTSLGIGTKEIESRLGSLLKRLGFLEQDLHSGYSAQEIVAGTKTDKKVALGQVHYVLLEQIGVCANLDAGASQAVSDDTVFSILDSLE